MAVSRLFRQRDFGQDPLRHNRHGVITIYGEGIGPYTYSHYREAESASASCSVGYLILAWTYLILKWWGADSFYCESTDNNYTLKPTPSLFRAMSCEQRLRLRFNLHVMQVKSRCAQWTQKRASFRLWQLTEQKTIVAKLSVCLCAGDTTASW